MVQAKENIAVKETEMRAKVGEKLKMELLSKTDTIIIGATFTVMSPSQYLQIDTVTSDKGTVKVENNHVTIAGASVKNGEALATVTYRILDTAPAGTTGTIAFRDILLYDTKGKEIANTDAFAVKVNMESQVSTNPVLKSLSITEGTIDFKEDTFTYAVTVPNDVHELHIKAEPKEAEAQVTIEGNILQVGENKVIIRVTSGTKSTEYTVQVTRKENTEKVEVSKINYTNMYVLLGLSVLVVFADIVYMIKKNK